MLTISPIPALRDNYIWLLEDINTREAWVVDPGLAQPVIQALQAKKSSLSGILLTHHHPDHSGGVPELLSMWRDIPVIASSRSPLSFITHPVNESTLNAPLPFGLNVLEVPGHTLDHLAFYNKESVFCGDTLFSMGCGRVFEGTPEQMHRSLTRLSALPPTTAMFCGHEYTLANLHFAQRVTPDNALIRQKIQAVKALYANHLASLPSTMGIETQLNPFLRCHEAAIIQAAETRAGHRLNNEVAVFAALREWKNHV
ncbi:MAG: hydroxyacylglutathione hydrolase [Gammaproteobacteria bacterium RIFCSPHIGHO2_12_FULL_45_12]|nr:MAG: hydroxyacylglutathione hydrolase [Gammaproteobacteria bacterium RIFCSPHIGHO2_12_FULL_45_12]